MYEEYKIDGLMQERCNTIANALEFTTGDGLYFETGPWSSNVCQWLD